MSEVICEAVQLWPGRPGGGNEQERCRGLWRAPRFGEYREEMIWPWTYSRAIGDAVRARVLP